MSGAARRGPSDSIRATPKLTAAIRCGKKEEGLIPLIQSRRMAGRLSASPQLLRRLGLMSRLPLLVSHAVDRLPRFVLAQGKASRRGRLLIPIGEAVPAKPRELHEVDVLNVGPLAKMADEPSEGFRLDLGPRLLIHDRLLLIGGRAARALRSVGVRAMQLDCVQRAAGLVQHLAQDAGQSLRPFGLSVGTEGEVLPQLDEPGPRAA